VFLSEVHLYSEPRCRSVDFQELSSYVKGLLPRTRVMLAGPIQEEYFDGFESSIRAGVVKQMAVSLAQAKVKALEEPVPDEQSVLAGEVAYEQRRLEDRKNEVFGLIYDAHILSAIYGSLISAEKSRIEHLHVIFTNQLIGTWDMADRRYHARTVLCGSPSIVSLSGITIAPAKDTGFYIARRSAEAFGFAEEEKMEVASGYAGDSLSLDDPRLTEVAKGYVAQALAHRLSGDAFCSDPDCRLYNAHRQRELIRAQLDSDSEYCGMHEELFNRQARTDGGQWTSDCT